MARVHSSLHPDGLAALAANQVNTFFSDGCPVSPADLTLGVTGALERLEHCFSQINNKYFFDGARVIFDHLHGDQYAMWLYFLSNEISRLNGPVHICNKLFLLNKALHGCDLFYEIELPSIFLLVHPLGTVLGRGQYEDYLLVYQRCSVGSNHDIFPRLGLRVSLRPGCAVLGNSILGENCVVAAESLLLDQSLPANKVYIGNPRDHVIRPNLDKESIWRT